MKTIQIRDAKASFSALVAAAEKGRHPGFADVAIAALAKHADLVLLSCNLKHFEPLGVVCFDPLVQLPS